MARLSCGVSIPGVVEKDGRYYKIIRNKWHGLSRIDEGLSALYRALYELDPARPDTVRELTTMFLAVGMDELKPATRAGYAQLLAPGSNVDRAFGSMRIGQLTSTHVAMYLEKRRKRGRGRVAANREKAALASAYNFGMRQGWAAANPCRGVRRNTEKPRRRHVTDAEFLEAFNASPEPFQDLLAGAYLSGCRETDVIGWRRIEHLKPSGIEFTESKTGKPHHVEWSDALRYFVRRAMARFPESEHVFTNKFGQPWTVWAINSQMDRLPVDWVFRDLRAKAQTDSPHSVLGHGAAMEAVYRKLVRTRPVR